MVLRGKHTDTKPYVEFVFSDLCKNKNKKNKMKIHQPPNFVTEWRRNEKLICLLVSFRNRLHQEITCQFLPTAPHIAGYKLKGEICLWSQQEITCQILRTVLTRTGYKLKGEVCLWSQQEITCQILHTVLTTTGYKLKGEVCLWSQIEIICQILLTVIAVMYVCTVTNWPNY